MNVGKLFAKLTLKDVNFAKGLKTANKHLNNMQREMKSAGRSVLNLQNAIVGLAGGYGLMKLSESFLNAAKSAETTKMMLKELTGSMARAESSFDWILGMKAPFSIDAMTDSFVKLQSVGIDPMSGKMKSLVDAVAAFGGGEEHIKRASIAIQQMAGKGVISMEEIRQQLAESVPTAMKIMARELDMTMKEFVDTVSKGGLNATTGLNAMFRGFEKDFGGAAERMMQTWSGMTIRMQREWKAFQIMVMDTGPFEALKKAFSETLESLEQFKRKGKLDEWAKTTAINIITAFGGVVQAIQKMVEAFLILKKTMVGLRAVFAFFAQKNIDTYERGIEKQIAALEKQKKNYERAMARKSGTGVAAYLPFWGRDFGKEEQEALDKLKIKLSQVAKEAEILRSYEQDSIKNYNKINEQLGETRESFGKIIEFLEDIKTNTNSAQKEADKYGDWIDYLAESWRAVEIATKKAGNALEDINYTSAQLTADKYGDWIDSIDESWRAVGKAQEELAESTISLWENTQNAIQDSIAGFLSDAIKGELETIEDYFRSFTNSLIDAWASMVAQMTMQKIAVSFGGAAAGATTGAAAGAASLGFWPMAGVGLGLAGISSLLGSGDGGHSERQRARIAAMEAEKERIRSFVASINDTIARIELSDLDYSIYQLNEKYKEQAEKAKKLGIALEKVAQARALEIKELMKQAGSKYTSLVERVKGFQRDRLTRNWGISEWTNELHDLSRQLENIDKNAKDYQDKSIEIFEKQFEVIQNIDRLNELESNSGQNLIDAFDESISSINGMITQLTTGSLAPVQSIEAFISGYEDLVSAVMGGDTDAVSDLGSYIPDYLSFMSAAGKDYSQLVDEIVSDLITMRDAIQDAKSAEVIAMENLTGAIAGPEGLTSAVVGNTNAVLQRVSDVETTITSALQLIELNSNIDRLINEYKTWQSTFPAMTAEMLTPGISAGEPQQWIEWRPLAEAWLSAAPEMANAASVQALQNWLDYMPTTIDWAPTQFLWPLWEAGQSGMGLPSDFSKPTSDISNIVSGDIHIHLELDGNEIAYIVTDKLGNNYELTNAIQGL